MRATEPPRRRHIWGNGRALRHPRSVAATPAARPATKPMTPDYAADYSAAYTKG
jgi:hypothetical protein